MERNIKAQEDMESDEKNERTAWLSVETTGLDKVISRICRIDILIVEGKSVIKTLNTFVNPTIPIPAEATEINGISDVTVLESPKFSEIADVVKSYLDECSAIGGDSVSFFDLPVLMAEFVRLEMPFKVFGKRIIDTQDIYRKYCRHGLDEKLRERLSPKRYSEMNDYIARNYIGYDNDAFRSLMLYRSLVDDFKLNADDIDDVCNNRKRIDLAGFFVKNEDRSVVLAKGKYKGQDINDVDNSYFSWMYRNESFDFDTRDVAYRIYRKRGGNK